MIHTLNINTVNSKQPTFQMEIYATQPIKQKRETESEAAEREQEQCILL